MGSGASMQEQQQPSAAVKKGNNTVVTTNTAVKWKRKSVTKKHKEEKKDEYLEREKKEEQKLYADHPEMTSVLERLDEINEYIKSNTNAASFAQSLKMTVEIDAAYWEFKNKHQRLLLGNHMAKIGMGDSITVLYKACIDSLGITAYTSASYSNPAQGLTYVIRSICWSVSDASKKFSEKLGLSGYVGYITEDLKYFAFGKTPATQNELRAFNASIGCIHNCAKVPSLKQLFRDLEMVKIVQPILKWGLEEPKAIAIMTLGYITDESQNDVLTADTSIFEFIISILKNAIKDPLHRYKGFSTEEMATGLGVLARNDDNKKIIVKNGALIPIQQLMESGDKEEKIIALHTLWVLAFDSGNREIIRGDPSLMAVVQNLAKLGDDEIQKEASGALWVLHKDERQKQRESGSGKSKQEASDGVVDEKKDVDLQHIMISYNWGDQHTMIKVKDRLKSAGFKVWMDIESMGGSTLQAMAEAVENSSVVLMCMCEQYKDSANCRTEAEYAFNLKKDIVPLIMQKGYKPDGWLGMILGAKLFFDFSGRYSFEAKFQELQKELGARGRSGQKVILPPIVAENAPVYGSGKRTSPKNWTSKEVAEWLEENDLDGIPGLSELTGPNLAFLRKMLDTAPEYFYHNMLENKMGITDLDDMMNVCEALESLPR